MTIHDASVFAIPDAYSPVFRTWYRFLHPWLGHVAARVITDSNFSRDELTHLAGIPLGKLRVIPLGAEHVRSVPPQPAALDRVGVNQPFVLAVASQSRHKNLQILADAFARLAPRGYRLVIAGAINSRIFKTSELVWPRHITALGYVSDGELRALYESAECFVYPSTYEGFGLPPLEAMGCGCPVLAARAAALPEVCGDAVVYFDPDDPVALAAAMQQVLETPALRESLRRRGREHAARYTWRRTAIRLLEVIDEAAGFPAGKERVH